MKRKTPIPAQKEMIPSQMRGFSSHTAVHNARKHEMPVSIPMETKFDHDFSRVSVQYSTPGFGQNNLNGSCPLLPQRCPFGGACHTCPPRVQAKLKVGQPGDKYEQEAERVAEQVIQMQEPSIQINNKAKYNVNNIQRISANSSNKLKSGNVIDLDQGGGRPLPTSIRTFMESRFGVDFSNVRLHTNQQAHRKASQIRAKAFTYGNHIWLKKGESEQNKNLIAHELTHIIQQRAGGQLASIVQRYTHQDCEERDLRDHIWPANSIAERMVAKAIRVLNTIPINPPVTPLFLKYFMTNTPSVPDILKVFTDINADFNNDDYQYECEYDCDNDNAYVYPIWTDIHLCMNKLRGRANDCIASTIVHEFSHYSAGVGDESGRCYGCGVFHGCPAGLSASDALDNADSYAAFAYELYPMPL